MADEDTWDSLEATCQRRGLGFVGVPDHDSRSRQRVAGQLRLANAVDRVAARLEHRLENGGRLRQTVHHQNARRVTHHDACLPCPAIETETRPSTTILRDETPSGEKRRDDSHESQTCQNEFCDSWNSRQSEVKTHEHKQRRQVSATGKATFVPRHSCMHPTPVVGIGAKANLTPQLGNATLRPSLSGLRLTKLRRLKRLIQENASHGGIIG